MVVRRGKVLSPDDPADTWFVVIQYSVIGIVVNQFTVTGYSDCMLIVDERLPDPTPRATIKAHPSTLHHPRPYGLLAIRVVRPLALIQACLQMV